MIEDKLKIIMFYKEILNEVYSSMINIPKVHYSLKDLIINEMFAYLNDLYMSNDISDYNVRMVKKEDVIIKFKYIFDSSAAKTVDRLIIVTDDHKIFISCR